MLDPGEVLLHWTATGDDDYEGQCAVYDMRYVPVDIGPIDTEVKWNQAIQLYGEPTPSPAGEIDSMLVSGLTPGAAYYFCIKARDEDGNCSPLSNSALERAAIGDFLAGDVNGSGHLNGLDVVYLVNYLMGGPMPPAPVLRADCNGDCAVNGLDVGYLQAYLMRGGPSPIRGDCDRLLSAKKRIASGL